MERRSSPRSPIRRKVSGRIPATPINATILDISASGCLGEVQNLAIKQGQTILLNLSATDEIVGRIVWQEGGRFGVEFFEEISEEKLSRLVAGADDHPTNDARMRDSFGRPLPPLKAKFRILPIT